MTHVVTMSTTIACVMVTYYRRNRLSTDMFYKTNSRQDRVRSLAARYIVKGKN